MNGLPVAAGLAQGQGEGLSVVGQVPAVQRNRPVCTQSVRVEQYVLFCAGFVLPPVDDRLILEALFAAVKKPPGDQRRNTQFVVLLQFAEAFEKSGALWKLRELFGGELCLCFHPFASLRAVDLLHPAVRIRNLRAVVDVDVIDRAGCRILEPALGSGGGSE